MIKLFKKWVYSFVLGGLLTNKDFISFIKDETLRDEQYIKNLYVILEKEKERVTLERRDTEQRRLAARYLLDIKKRQDNCRHTKGGRLPGLGVDYNIWIHTFTTGKTTVRCLTCGKEWSGEQLKSEEVQKMMRSTTNTPSASESAYGKKYHTEHTVVFQDVVTPQVALKNDKPRQSIMSYIVDRMNFIRKYNKIRQGGEHGPYNLS